MQISVICMLWSSDFVSYLEDILMDKLMLYLIYCSHDTKIERIIWRPMWPIFHGPAILPFYFEDCLVDKCHT